MEISIFLDTMIQRHTKSLTIGSIKPTRGLRRRTTKEQSREIDRLVSLPKDPQWECEGAPAVIRGSLGGLVSKSGTMTEATSLILYHALFPIGDIPDLTGSRPALTLA